MRHTCTAVLNAFFANLYIINNILWSLFIGILIISFTAIFGYQTLLDVFVSKWYWKIQEKKMRCIGCVAWIFSKPIAEVYKCVSLISFSASWCMLLFTESLIYFLVYTSTQVFDRISVSHGVPREHCEDTWWPRWMGAVGQPSIRRLRSQILLYLIKPMSWVEVYLVLRYIFVRKESALQVKVSSKTPPRENKEQTGEEDLVFESLFFFLYLSNAMYYRDVSRWLFSSR